MRDWNLHPGDPLSLFLAADARLGVPDYTDDQVWELCLQGGDPPALAAETMLGLRAACLRLYPVFVVDGRSLQDPADFFSRPEVIRFAPNYLMVRFAPVKGLEVTSEYWAPDSHALSGRIALRASGEEAIRGECGLCGVLRPTEGGAPFMPESAGPLSGVYLRGKVRGGAPVMVAAGSAGIGRGATPTLRVPMDIGPGKTQCVRWAFCCLPSAEEGLQSGRSLLVREWDADIARVELAGAALIDFETGRADWDSVLAFSQVAAVQSLIGPTRRLPRPSPVIGRNPERGYSMKGDGSDYFSAWNGATLWDLLMILPVWSRADPETAKDLIRNFSCGDEGPPDARPGAANQRANQLAPPLLGQTVWRALAGREDPPFLAEMLPAVERCLEAWFDPARGGDADRVPRWERIDSLGPDIPPMWAREDPWGGWIAPAEVECPSLAALLYGECHAAARMAELCGRKDRAELWRRRGEEMRRALAVMETGRGYRTVDRVTRAGARGERLWEGSQGKEDFSAKAVDPPSRVMVRCLGGPDTQPKGVSMKAGVRVLLRGVDDRGAECGEEARGETFVFSHGAGACHLRTVWRRIDSVRVESPAPETVFRLEIPGLDRSDLSHYLPLWSRSAAPAVAERMFAGLEGEAGFDSPRGLRFAPESDPAAGVIPAGGVWMLWNMLMGEAAIRCGKESLARKWIGEWMEACADSLRADRSFRSCYHPQRRGGYGPRNSLHGIFPVGVFLAALGVHPVSPGRVWVGGRSIFPFPVTLRCMGMVLRREGEALEVEFPTGRKQSVRGIERRLVADG